MSWTTTRTAVSALATAKGFALSPEIFSIEKAPASQANKVYCIQLDEMQPNKDGFGDSQDRFFPTQRIRISAMFDLFNGSQSAYDTAIDENMKLIQALIDPNNRSGDIRMVEFANMKTKTFKDQDNWLIVDNYFDLQVQVTFPT